MKTIFFFKKLSEIEEKNVQEYVFKKLGRIERLIPKMPSDGALLHVTCEKFEKHSAYEVEFVLALPSSKLVSKEASHAITKAIDLAFDRLISQVKKSKEL